MAASGSWKLARILGAFLAFWLTLAIVYLALKGNAHEVHGVVTRAAVWMAWIAGTLMAWWCAGDRAGIDRAEGIESLARVHGIDPRTLFFGRFLSATLRIAALIGMVTLPVMVASLAAAPTLRDGGFRLLSLVPLGIFALAVGLMSGGLACGCSWLSPRHGRSWLSAIVLAPWALDGIVTSTRAHVGSIPALLGALADLVTRVGGGL